MATIPLILLILGSVLVLSGSVTLAFGRRIAENLRRASLVRGDGAWSKAYAFGIASSQILFGILLIVVPFARSNDSSVLKLDPILHAIAQEMGLVLVPLCLLLIVSSILGMCLSVTLVRRAWRRRNQWGDESAFEVPRADVVRIATGVVLGAYSVLSLIASVLLWMNR